MCVTRSTWLLAALASCVACSRPVETVGHVSGPITCAQSSLQQTDPEAGCYGTRPSDDTFKPNMFGLEGVYGATTRSGRFDLFVGSGFTWLRPRFEVGFTNLDGVTDNTQIEVDLTRVAESGAKLGCTNGGISLTLPTDAKASISARITNGGINTSGVNIETTGENSRRHLEGRMNGGGPRIEIDGTNGGIRIASR